MMSPFQCAAPRHLTAALLLGLACASGALAQANRHGAAVEVAQLADAVPPGDAQPLRIRRIDIGTATQTLWDLQRASPGARPRPIDGEQASRSYQRYLKSFETTIPEHYNAGLGLEKK